MAEEKGRVAASAMNEDAVEMQPTPPAYNSTTVSGTAKPINTQMNWSIFNLVFSILCGFGGFAFSIVALVFSIFAKRDLELQLYDSAEKSSRFARIFNIVATVLTVVGLIIYIIVIVLQIIAAVFAARTVINDVTNFFDKTTTSYFGR